MSEAQAAALEVLLAGSDEVHCFIAMRYWSPRADETARAVAAFQPDALTISRGHPWEDRRRFAEAVLDTGHPVHRLAQAFVEKVARTVEGLGAGALKWSDWNAAFQRLTRSVVFGDKGLKFSEIGCQPRLAASTTALYSGAFLSGLKRIL